MNKLVRKNCIESLKKPGPPIIIATLPEEAEAIYNACRDNGINVTAFCDNELRRVEKGYCGLEVIHTPSLTKRFPKARIIIAFFNLDEPADQLSELGYSEFYSPLELLEDYDINKHKHRHKQSYIETKISISKKSHSMYFDETKTYLRSLDIMITTKCSMKCKSCANLMQYYVDAKNTDDGILAAVKTLSDNVDAISEFRVIGGEPLMNKNWAKIVNGIVEQDSKREIFIYTNGTIAPKDDDLKTFKGKDVNFYITNYGKLSKNVNKMIEGLEKYDIGYMNKPADYWVDCSNIKQHNRLPKENKTVFKECCAKHFYTLLNGKLYTCPFIANAANLNAIPLTNSDYVDLSDNTQDLRHKISRLVNMKNFFPACDFCDGRPLDPTTAKQYDGQGFIKAAEQTSGPINFKKY
jgi:organic radical activating enzyme